ncbi:MAG: hypothetical protein ACOYO1_07550 [Bacteroidales bacterium]
MVNLLIFPILPIILAICGISISVLRKNLFTTMIKYDSSYTGWVNNTFDMIRIFKVYFFCRSISKEEKKQLKIILILFIVGLMDGIILAGLAFLNLDN